ncbi:MAG TPA: hypothetical protein VHC86_06885 [Opitutaceae bacterium]|nr:hypothetical protein [Opitutaceae bacterium]
MSESGWKPVLSFLMRRLSPHRWLAALLAASFGLRVWLACLGGQYFWPDEMRYGQARIAAEDLAGRHWRAALGELFGHADHTLFRLFCLPAALAEQAWGNHPALAASYLGLFSTAAIGLIWAIARRAGAGPREALWAALLAAGSSTLFYYSRHLLPYDVSLAILLGACWLALGPASPWNSFLAGAATGIGFLAYNGYWLLGGAILVLHALIGAGGIRRAPARALASALGLAAPIAAVVGLGEALGYPIVAGYREASGLAHLDFHLGYRLLPEFLWHAEGPALLLWLLGWAAAVAAWRGPCRRLAWYAGAVALIAGGLVIFSDVVPHFQVQGRQVRAVVPFLVLGAAFGLNRLTLGRGQLWTALAAAAAVACAVATFLGPLRQWFPPRFEAAAEREVARRAGGGFRIYREDFAFFLWAHPIGVPPAGTALLRRLNPFQFRPYQYEGYDQARRDEINRHDIAMRLTELPFGFARDPLRWAGYPGPVRFRVVFPRGKMGLSEPLVTAGRPPGVDFLYVSYLDSRHLLFGFDRWGGGAVNSEPIEVDYERPHELVVWLGSLLPPAGSAAFAAQGFPAAWRDQLMVAFDGQVVFFRPQEFFPVRPEEITFGANTVGGTVAQPFFSGTVLAFEPAPSNVLRRDFSAFFPSADGRLQLRLQLPRGRAGRREPLVVTGIPGRADLLEIRYDDDRHVSFALDHWSRSFLESPPVALDYARPHTFELDLPVLSWPEPADGGAANGEMTIRIDGAVAWRASVEFYREARATFSVAANRIGGSTCDPAFSGVVLSASSP